MKKSELNLFKLFVLASISTVLIYGAIRIISFALVSSNWLDKILSLALLFGELFILIHAIGYTLNVIRAFTQKSSAIEKASLKKIPPSKQPSVALLVAARHEPYEVLDNTFLSLKSLDYKNKDIFFLDDSSDENYKKEAEEICKKHGIHLFRRKVRHGAKAGVINDCLKNLDHKYVAIFDADQCPLPNFLNELVPMMEANSNLAFIQTPQFYSNMDESRVARAAAFQQAVFYEYICEGKSTREAMFCCGTNIVFRAKALKEAGGLDESTVTEDFATSVKIHLKGWESLYYNHVSTFGMGPENLTGYFKQQFRWAIGTLTVFKSLLKRLILHPRSLSPVQWCEYFMSSSYYAVGLAMFVLIISPICFIFTNRPSLLQNPTLCLIAYIPYITLSMGIFIFALGYRNYRFKDIFLGQLLGFCTFSIYARAALSALFGLKAEFGITEKTKVNAIPYKHLWPQLSLFILSFIALVWTVNRFIYERNPALIINGVWTLYHCGILSSILYFNETDPLKMNCPALPKKNQFKYKVTEAPNPEAIPLDKATWQTAFSVFVSERLELDTPLLCKVLSSNKKSILFEAKTIWVSDRQIKKGFETILGVESISNSDKKRLKEVLSYD